MRFFRSQWLLFALLMLLAPLRPAAAQTVIYDTLGPTNAHAGNGFQVNSAEATAASFTSGSTRRRFAGVLLPLRYIDGTNSLEVRLMSHAVDRPGVVLESMNVSTSGVAFETTLVTANSALTPVLEANTTYWIALVASGNTRMTGNFNTFDVRGTSFGNPTTGTWDAEGDNVETAMRVFAGDEVPLETDAVPEPGAAMLFLTALAALALARRRHGTSV